MIQTTKREGKFKKRQKVVELTSREDVIIMTMGKHCIK